MSCSLRKISLGVNFSPVSFEGKSFFKDNKVLDRFYIQVEDWSDQNYYKANNSLQVGIRIFSNPSINILNCEELSFFMIKVMK